MSNAAEYRTELSVATADYDRILADIRSDTVHAIVGTVMRLNKQGHRFSISFESDGSLSIYQSGETLEKGAYIKAHGSIGLSTAAELINALEQLEAMDKPAATEDDISIIFNKEDAHDAETV